MKSFEDLQVGDVIENVEDGEMSVMLYDFNGDGEKIMCFADRSSIYPASQFDPEDWKLKKADI